MTKYRQPTDREVEEIVKSYRTMTAKQISECLDLHLHVVQSYIAKNRHRVGYIVKRANPIEPEAPVIGWDGSRRKEMGPRTPGIHRTTEEIAEDERRLAAWQRHHGFGKSATDLFWAWRFVNYYQPDRWERLGKWYPDWKGEPLDYNPNYPLPDPTPEGGDTEDEVIVTEHQPILDLMLAEEEARLRDIGEQYAAQERKVSALRAAVSAYTKKGGE